MKQTKLWLTTIAALLCSLTASAHDFEMGGIYYNITSSTNLTVSVTYKGSNHGSYSNEYSGAITIPSTVTYDSKTYSVTSIGYGAFSNCTSLTSITLPEGVTNIGDGAFYKCTNLISITLPESVTSIGGNTFEDCRSLTSITIPKSVTSIGIRAFGSCSNLTDITIPEGVTNIGEHAFAYCTNLTSVVIPEGVTRIGGYTFYGCSSLSAINIPEGVTSIGGGAFGDCKSLTDIHIASIASWLTIKYGDSDSHPNYLSTNAKLYIDGKELTKVEIPSSVTSIPSLAFYNCSSLTSVVISEGVTSIGGRAFYNCSNLTSITLPESVTSIKDEAFYRCTGELTVNCNIPSASPNYRYGAFNRSKFSKVIIGSSVTSIAEYAFHDCSSLYSVTIGSGVLSIGEYAFRTPQKVIWLTNTPPTGYANAEGSINYVANDQYSNLSNVKVYPYLSSMFEVDGVKYVPISPSERTCHAIDCAYNSTAESININETTSFKGVSMKVTEVMPYTFYGNGHIKEVSVSHLGNISDYAFYDCNGIKTIEVNNRGSIGAQVFYGCTGMETAIVANLASVSSSNNDAPQTFADWTSTNHNHSSTSSKTYTFTVGEGATLSFNWSVSSEASYDKLIATLDGITILEKSGSWSGTYSNAIDQGSHTLVVKYTKDGSNSSGSDQASVSNITVGKGGTATFTTGVGSEAFSGCSALKTVTLGDSIGSLGSKAFYQCTSLQEIVIPDSVKAVGTYCFSGCSAMRNAIIGKGVATINNCAFQNCSSLSEISIPQSTNTIGDYAFSDCSQLADVIIEDRTTALSLGSNGSSSLFADCPLDSVYIGGKITYNTTSNMGYSPFYRNTSLRTVVITDREEQIYANEFYGCTNLQSVTIGNGVKSIGNYAFSGCSSLEGFSFGNSMESVGDEAFSDCTNLTSLTSYVAVPPTCGSQALDDINKWNCTLYIPTGSLAAYMAADQWKEFFFIEDNVTDGIEDIIMNDKQTEIIYDLQGRRVRNTDNLRGIYIINGKKAIK